MLIENIRGKKVDKTDIKSMNLKELEEFLVSIGEKAFRGKQVFQWIHQKYINGFDEMTNISKDLRQKLEADTRIYGVKEVEKWVSAIDGTTKYLFELYDGHIIESVLMKYKHGNSVCISSQVGCRMGCRFCASTLDGLTRNLMPSEMLDQIYAIERTTGERVSNVVIMGTGEPFDNYENVLRFLELITHKEGKNLSQRGITVSTCGLVPRIREFAELETAVNLAISLHAPNDDMRKELMPIANRYSIEQIMEACKYYIMKTNRRVTFEYSLVANVNDKKEHAQMLSGLLSGVLCHVNLIPVNPIEERNYRQSTQQSIQNFKNLLEKNRINVTIRREMGRDIQAACGQLRKKYKANHS